MKLRVLAVLSVGLFAPWVVMDRAEASPFAPGAPVAQAKAGGKAAAKPGAGKMKGTVMLAPKGMKWGLGNEQIAKLYDKYFEEMYAAMLRKMPVGPQADALNSELDDKKDLIRRNLLGFGAQVTGVDSTALKGEYSYQNKESMSKVTLHGGLTRYFFYFSDQVWKIYDEHPLKEGGPLGATFASAIEALTARFGVAPKKIDPDYDRGRNFEEAHWSDGTTLVRLVNREGEKLAPIVYVDESIQGSLAKLRPNRPQEERLDRSVTEATAPPPKVQDAAPKKKK